MFFVSAADCVRHPAEGLLLFSTQENKELIGLDTITGRIMNSVRAANANIVYADSKLFVYGHHFSFPVIADGVMYIRRGDALMAYAVK